MKRLRYLLLAALAGFSVLVTAAKPLTVKWSIADAVTVVTGGLYETPVELTAGATEITFAEAPRYVAVFPAQGYALTGGTLNSSVPANRPLKTSFTSTTGQYIASSFYASTIDTMGDNPTMTVEVVKVEREETMTIEIENGLACVDVAFESLLGYRPDLKAGTNIVKFNPEYDRSILVSLVFGQGAETLYKVEFNGEPIAKSLLRHTWSINSVAPGDKLTIRAFEGEEQAPVFCDYTIAAPEGAIASVFNLSASKFIDLEGGTLSVPRGTDLYINLNTTDFTFKDITLNGNSLMSSFSRDYSRLTLTADEGGELVFDAEEREYFDLPMRVYIMNPEGVRLTAGTYRDGVEQDLSGGEAISADEMIAGYVLSADETRKFNLSVNERAPYMYVHARKGWYIKAVLGFEEGSYELVNRVEFNYLHPDVYIIAEPFEDTAFINVDLLGTGAYSFSGNAALSGMWDNPVHSFRLTQGLQTVGFIAGYDDPFKLHAAGSLLFGVYLDGVAVMPDDDGNFFVGYTAPAIEGVYPKITINNSGKEMYSGALSVEGDPGATVTYGDVRNPAVSPYTYLQGTPIFITPSIADAVVSLNGTPLTAGADGTFTFPMPIGIAKVTIEENTGVEGVTAAPEAECEYYNLQGVRVASPAAGAVYIRRTGSTATKVKL